MLKPITIPSDLPENPGLDYAALKAEGIALVQQLSGAIWTDYNEHDPGVTTLEQLCYALTELSYRAEFSLADLLVNRRTGRANPQRQALFPPARIYPCNPLTENDYRKLIIDRIQAVANVWMWPRSPSAPPKINGLYDMALYVPQAKHQKSVRRHAWRLYNRHRNLCENVGRIHLLQPLRTVVRAEVSITDEILPERILAGLFFNLGMLLAPEPRRRSLNTLLDLGIPPGDMFNGPLLYNGFIDDAQLQPKATSISVQDMTTALSRSPGAAGVGRVSVRLGHDGPPYTGQEHVPIPRPDYLHLDTHPHHRDGTFSIRLIKNGSVYTPDPARVERELEQRWAEARRTYRLLPSYRENFAFPQGQYRDVKTYYSIQNQYPGIYGIGALGLPEGAPVARQAQAKQLKGYLLAFEQLMANFFAQLARAKDLFSTSPRLRHTYFFQHLNRDVPNVEPLLKKAPDGTEAPARDPADTPEAGYWRGLRRIVYGQDPFVARRNRFLDFLLALYGEQLDAYAVWETPRCHRAAHPGKRLIRAKLDLLKHLVGSTHNRGRGFDYLGRTVSHNIAGMEIKSRIQLGMAVAHHRSLQEVLDALSLTLAEPDEALPLGTALTAHSNHIETYFTPVFDARKSSKYSDEEWATLLTKASLLRARTLTASFLYEASQRAHYRVGQLPGEEQVSVVLKLPSRDEWVLIGAFSDLMEAEKGVFVFADLMQRLHCACQQLYIVEHNLLKAGHHHGHHDHHDHHEEPPEASTHAPPHASSSHHPPEDFAYSFTITAVVSTGGKDYRTFVRQVIRQNTPSHIAIQYCFLTPAQMYHFERHYRDWRKALRHQHRSGKPSPHLAAVSGGLRAYLAQCQRRHRQPDAEDTSEPDGVVE